MADHSVLIVGNFLSGHVGVRGVCEELAVRLQQVGWSVITTSDRASKVARMYDMVRTAWARRRNYSVAQVDLFSGPAFLWGEAVCHTLRAAGKPFVITLHGGSLPEFAAQHEVRCRKLLRSAAAVTAPSNFLREAMRRFRDDVVVLPNALEIANYPFRLRSQARPNLVWVRAFDAIYNPVLAVRAMRIVTSQFPEARLIMVGPDKGDGTFGATRAEALKLGLQDRVEFTGRVPKQELAASINRGDIFLNTTNIDNTPVTVMEAMACGACVVSTNVGGIPYILKQEENALLVPPGNPEAMAAAIIRLIQAPELAARLSRAGRTTAEQIDWPVVLNRWIHLLSSHARG
ncbi:MAG: glycosyltransferase family 4 protein [Bryobacteraceae bacterium]|nr:glycosyltransferase family 4 protein [Bryobacteraceae bacterium]